MDSKIDHLTMGQREIFLTNDTLMLKIKRTTTEEDAGIYWMEFNKILVGQNASSISGGTKDNYTSILKLECHNVSTSIRDCQLVNNSMYIMWYKNGMRMTELDPTLSQINVTVDHNGGNFTCKATEYFPGNEGLQTTTPYPYDAPTDVKLEPNQREITVTTDGPSDVKLEPHKRETTVTTETEMMNNVIVAAIAVIVVAIIIAVIVVVITVIIYNKYKKKKHYRVIYWRRTEYEEPEDIVYAELDLNTPDWYKIYGIKPESEVEYSTIDFAKKAPKIPRNMELDSDDEDQLH
ncbi:hypothetical protein LOTGIDRAFT_165139 [Lottia gigantea]|uniref:Ig-like domain-containing protein n=1 Tax=Lottia gigantea TaxID=225164 RepID=V3ZYT1_LOTGI|nr:hypothetical protein LOTGIDRAFT_165139 [Lottia gigantea]ESO89547.1 hypothetical protein LOTGIDRAFT_165139 [Lottia gigantea]